MWATLIPVGMQVIGNLMQGNASATAGRRQRAAAEFEAAQLEQASGQYVATSQRARLDEKRKGDLVASRILALAAAGGGGTGDGVMDLIANVHAEAAYRGGIALYQGEEKRRQLLMAADARRYEGALAEESGNARKDAASISALGALFKGGASLYNNYGAGGPKSPVESRSFDTGSTSSIGTGGIDWDIV